MNTDLLTVTRDNALVQSSYSLTLNERRAVELAIAKVKFGEAAPALVEITAQEFSTAFGVNIRTAYRDLQNGVDRLYERSIEIVGIHAEKSLTKFRIVTRADYVPEEGRVLFRFTREMQQLLLATKEKGGYTTYKLLHVKRLSSAHAARLFELLMQFKDTGFRVDSLANLKAYFGVQGKYPRWVDFDKRVLKPATKSLNASSIWIVNYKTKKKGRKIDRVEFTFSRKSQGLLDL